MTAADGIAPVREKTNGAAPSEAAGLKLMLAKVCTFFILLFDF